MNQQFEHRNKKRQNNDEMGILGKSLAIHQVREIIREVAPTNIPVLIEGESGTGKELVAGALHQFSNRKNKPMFTVNCGAIPEGILESELFGHQRGAFTGAVESRKGYFELAEDSTLFLDEIGEMPLTTQVKVLRVMEQKEFMRVGGSTYQHVDVRIITATNKNLQEEVRSGNFRQDLYFRLNAVKIVVPPLRDRPEDIPLLVDKFVAEFSRENKTEFAGFSAGAMDLLKTQAWVGNVRELRNLIQRVIVLEKGQLIDEDTLNRYLVSEQDHRHLPVPTDITGDQTEREFIYRVLLELKSDMNQIKQLLFSQFVQPKSLHPWRGFNYEHGGIPPVEEIKPEDELRTLEEVERDLIQRTLEHTNWSKRKTAQILGISERTLYRKINEYNLQEKNY